jgi:hypothetical protein
MNGRSSTTTRSTSRILREVAGTARRALPLAVVTALLGGILAAGLAAVVAATSPVHYTAAAEFDFLARPEAMEALSLNRSLLAEQVVRSLEKSRAPEYAASAAPKDEFTGKWVVGPGFGELSYEISSDDPKIATAAAQAVYDNAGFLGFDLVSAGQPRPALDLVGVRPAAPTRQSAAKTVGAAGVLGGFAGFALALLLAVPARRPRTTL